MHTKAETPEAENPYNNIHAAVQQLLEQVKQLHLQLRAQKSSSNRIVSPEDAHLRREARKLQQRPADPRFRNRTPEDPYPKRKVRRPLQPPPKVSFWDRFRSTDHSHSKQNVRRQRERARHLSHRNPRNLVVRPVEDHSKREVKSPENDDAGLRDVRDDQERKTREAVCSDCEKNMKDTKDLDEGEQGDESLRKHRELRDRMERVEKGKGHRHRPDCACRRRREIPEGSRKRR